jgi:hypothetical protein
MINVTSLLLLLTTIVLVHANNTDTAGDVAATMANRLLQKIIQHDNAPLSWSDVLLPAMEYSFLNKKTKTTSHPSYDEDNGRRRALQWLVYEDEASSTMSSYEYDTTLLQRYALATIYYTTGGDEWTYCSKSAGEGAEREFNSPCEGGAQSRFLSNKSHLLWGGVMGHDGQVTMLDISNRGLTSLEFLPPEILLLGPSLELLWLHDNISFKGSLPTYLNGNSFPNLASLSVHKTSMAGTIPQSIYTLSKLSSLRLYRSNFTGTLSSNIGQLTNLKWLWIHDNSFSGTVPVELGLLSKLEGLTLHNNNFTPVLEYNVTEYGLLEMNILPDTVCNLTKYDLRYLWTDCEENDLVAAAAAAEEIAVVEEDRFDETMRTCSCCTRCFPRQMKTKNIVSDAYDALDVERG